MDKIIKFVRICHLNLDPEPVYAQNKAVRKLKGRKAKVTSVDLEGKQGPGENDFSGTCLTVKRTYIFNDINQCNRTGTKDNLL